MIYRKQKAWHVNYVLGTHSPSKTDEFSEKFQTAFDPSPPSFSESYVAEKNPLFQFHGQIALFKGPNFAT